MGCGSCSSAGERCGSGLEKIYPTTAVRFGRMRHIGEFSHMPDMKFGCGVKVVIATDRGIEIGDQVSLTCFGCEKSVSRDQMRSYAQTSGGDTYRLKCGRILREATASDLSEWKHIEDSTFDMLQTCRRFAAEIDLPMKIVDAEHIFGGERIVFFFMAEERVDFRELVHRLASEFQTRIEMRQVGARDEARLVADYETCGRECCCKNFLKTLKPISMSMAKLQKATLDLSKVSGRCGRLKCCLRYEHEGYESLEKKLPRMGTYIRTSHGTGQVVDRQILTQLVQLRENSGKLLSVVVEDILETNLPAPPPPPPGQEMGEDAGPRGRPRWQPRRPEPPAPLAMPTVPQEEEDDPAPGDEMLDSNDDTGTDESGFEEPPTPSPPGPAADFPGPASDPTAEEKPDPGRPPGRGRRGRRRRRFRRPGGPDGGAPGPRGPDSPGM